PLSSIFSPLLSVSIMLSNIISTNCSASFLVISASSATFSTKSAFVIFVLRVPKNKDTSFKAYYALFVSDSSLISPAAASVSATGAIVSASTAAGISSVGVSEVEAEAAASSSVAFSGAASAGASAGASASTAGAS